MDPIFFIIVACVLAGGVLASLGVHLLPVGGAPAAMATATGVATGTVMLMFGAAMCGLFTAASVATYTSNLLLVSLSGAVGSWLMMGVTMLLANLLYVFGSGVVPVSGRVDVDPITREPQKAYKTPQCDGHGVPNVSFVSGMIGALLGGFGGALMYFALLEYAKFEPTMAGVAAMGIFVANAIIAAYNIGGTIEGFQDPKFKRLPKAILTCGVISLLSGVLVWVVANMGGLIV
jgi:tetrahydromethanopterin S-methyltransferase subunit D